MALQFSVGVRNKRGNAIETEIGTAPTLQIRSGNKPAACSNADSGSLLCTITLPSDWYSAFAAGVGTKVGTWSGVATGAGTAGHFRIRKAGSPDSCEIQGNITPASSSPTAEMEIDNASIAISQTVTVTLFTITEGNA